MVKIRLLDKNYKKNEELYHDFMNNSISEDKDYFSGEIINLEDAPYFPIYIATMDEVKKQDDFKKAISTILDHYINTDRSIHLSGRFWHSWEITKRDEIIKDYGELIKDFKDFNRIVTRKFDWENYIYKCVIAAEYIQDSEPQNREEEEKYIEIIVKNLDLYNYILKTSVFKNRQFTMNFLAIIEEKGLSEIMKSRIKDRPDLHEKDPRYGRRVIFELNKNYPIIQSPLMTKQDLSDEIMKALKMYR